MAGINPHDPDEPYRAYDTGYIGAEPEAGFSHGGHAAHQLGADDAKHNRDHAPRSDIRKTYLKAQRTAPPAPADDDGSQVDPSPSPSPAGGGPSRRSGYFARSNKLMSKPIGQAGRPVTSHIVRGDGTGLVLAIVLYPLLLSIVKYGAKGPGMYFQAKWLNKPPSSAPASATGTDATTSALLKLPTNASGRGLVTI